MNVYQHSGRYERCGFRLAAVGNDFAKSASGEQNEECNSVPKSRRCDDASRNLTISRFRRAVVASIRFLVRLTLASLNRLAGGISIVTVPKDLGYPPYLSFSSSFEFKHVCRIYWGCLDRHCLMQSWPAHEIPHHGPFVSGVPRASTTVSSLHSVCRYRGHNLSDCNRQGSTQARAEHLLSSWPAESVAKLVNSVAEHLLSGPTWRDPRYDSWREAWNDRNISVERSCPCDAGVIP